MIPSDPLYAQQWHFDHLGNIEKIWDEYSGAGIRIGVYDSGVDATHPDFDGNYDASLNLVFDDLVQSGAVNTGTQTDAKTRGHGTAVAGIIAAENNGQGVVGVAWDAKLASINIGDSSNPYNIFSGVPADLAEAIAWSVGHFDVVNNSWGTAPHYDPNANVIEPAGHFTVNGAFAEVCESGRGGLGTVVVQSAGNEDLDAQGAGLNGSRFTVTVGGYGPDGFIADYANYGACLLVSAPTRPSLAPTGDEIVTTDLFGPDGYNGTTPNGYTDNFGGTSAAAPMVSGIVALMLDANAGLGWRDVQNILAVSANHTGSTIGAAPPANEHGSWFFNDAANWNGGGMHFSNDYGYGAVDAYAAVRMAEVWSLFGKAQTGGIEGGEGNEQIWNGFDGADHAIPDPASGALEVGVNLAPNPSIDVEHVDVRLELTHDDYRDLRIYLVSPGGTETQLYDGSGGSDTTADGGLAWIYGVDALRGEQASGTWKVRVEDTDPANTGMVTFVRVIVYGSAASSDDVYHYTDEFLAMKALSGQSGRATLTDAGGTDWIDAAAVTGNVALNLNPGVFTKVNGANWFKVASGTTIEHAVTGDGNDTLIGNGAANKLHGMRGNDTIDGAGGNDQMFGGKGNDTYVVAQSGDVADETGGNGTDTVKASISFSLADTVHAKGTIEHLTLTGTGAINATGNGLANTLTGNGAANLLDGAGNNDTMRGMGGSDTYAVGQTGDVVDETGGNGTDLVKAAINFSLADTAKVKGSVENLTLTGSAAINATGNGLANTLVGNVGANVLDGSAGSDTMTGGGGADRFLFASALDAATNVDHLTDFAKGTDTLALDASFFQKLKVGDLKKKAFLAKKGAEKAKDKFDRVIYDTNTGEVRFDKDGKGKTKAVLVAVLDGGPDLAHSDILVVA